MQYISFFSISPEFIANLREDDARTMAEFCKPWRECLSNIGMISRNSLEYGKKYRETSFQEYVNCHLSAYFLLGIFSAMPAADIIRTSSVRWALSRHGAGTPASTVISDAVMFERLAWVMLLSMQAPVLEKAFTAPALRDALGVTSSLFTVWTHFSNSAHSSALARFRAWLMRCM